MKLLTVDDSLMIRRLIVETAQVINMESVTAKCAEDAITILEREGSNISLILLDWNMPGMSGYDLLKVIKADPRWSQIPVMMVTSESYKTQVIMAIKAGAAGYLMKPFAQQDLATKILQCLGLGT